MMKLLVVKTPHLYLTALAIGLAIGLIYTLFLSGDKAEGHTVTITKDGFIPSSLSIKQGEAVTFVSDGSVEEFWPASDSHPSHGIYPELDPRQPINANKSWTFVFDKTGLWKMHDHMNSHSEGEIIVYSQEGFTTDTCVQRMASDEVKFQPQCWENEFKNLLNNQGEEKLFTTLNSYTQTDEVFKNNCHDVMHIVGDIIYDSYLKTGTVNFNTNMTTCGYGFFHGFVEAIYSDTGSYEMSREFCESLESSNDFISSELAKGAAAACWHGVGHAIFDSQDGRYWGNTIKMMETALQECELVFSVLTRRQGCASGVFNAVDVAFSRKYYGLNYDENNPFSHCLGVAEDYKYLCLLDVGTYYAAYKNLDRTQAITLFETVDEKYFPEIIKSWVADNVQWRMINYDEIYREANQCFGFDNKDVIDACLEGVHLGIFKKNGPLENQGESKKVCDNFTDHYKKTKCEQFIYVRI